MKKLVALLLALCMVACLFAGCSGDAEESTAATVPTEPSSSAPDASSEDATDPAPTDPIPAIDYSAWHVAMITDYGDITDQSFNQTTYEAGKAWCEARGVDFKYYKPVADSTADRVAQIDAAVADGYNVLLLPGFAFAGSIKETQDVYPEVYFIGLDVSEWDLEDAFYNHDADGNRLDLIDPNDEPHVSDNVYCAVYQEELAGYMAGYAAVKLGYTKLGYLGGMAVPAVIRYGYGFVQGCDAAAVEMGVENDVTIEYVYGNQFFGDADITSYMDTWYQTKGVQIVFACGGGIFTSAGEAAAKVEGAKVIGVDVDQKGTIDGMYGDGITVTSAMKGLAATVNTMLTQLIDEDNWAAYSGKIETLGLVSGDDPTLNYVQIPSSTQWSDAFTEADYVDLVAKMFSGEITVSNDITAKPETSIQVTDNGTVK